jgi:hypothetical protein
MYRFGPLWERAHSPEESKRPILLRIPPVMAALLES